MSAGECGVGGIKDGNAVVVVAQVETICPACTMPWFNPQFCINWVWVLTYYSNIWGLKAEIKGHCRLHRELEACLGYKKP